MLLGQWSLLRLQLAIGEACVCCAMQALKSVGISTPDISMNEEEEGAPYACADGGVKETVVERQWENFMSAR